MVDVNRHEWELHRERMHWTGMPDRLGPALSNGNATQGRIKALT
jgi:hypothetical protein